MASTPVVPPEVAEKYQALWLEATSALPALEAPVAAWPLMKQKEREDAMLEVLKQIIRNTRLTTGKVV